MGGGEEEGREERRDGRGEFHLAWVIGSSCQFIATRGWEREGQRPKAEQDRLQKSSERGWHGFPGSDAAPGCWTIEPLSQLGEKAELHHKPKRFGLCYDSCMPTVLRFGRYRVVVYPNDHRPAHVHVIGPEQEAVFALNCPAGPVTVRENYSCSQRELSQIAENLLKNLLGLCEAWRRMHASE